MHSILISTSNDIVHFMMTEHCKKICHSDVNLPMTFFFIRKLIAQFSKKKEWIFYSHRTLMKFDLTKKRIN